MGFGEVVGNESVHWRQVHEDHAPGGPKTRLKDPGKPVTGVENLTVVDYEVRGVDTVPFNDIGHGGPKKGHRGKFRVRMRFATREAADTAFAALTKAGPQQQGGLWELVIDVPAVHRQIGDVGPPAKPDAEVRIDW